MASLVEESIKNFAGIKAYIKNSANETYSGKSTFWNISYSQLVKWKSENFDRDRLTKKFTKKKIVQD